jgi:hypothetical protein
MMGVKESLRATCGRKVRGLHTGFGSRVCVNISHNTLF